MNRKNKIKGKKVNRKSESAKKRWDESRRKNIEATSQLEAARLERHRAKNPSAVQSSEEKAGTSSSRSEPRQPTAEPPRKLRRTIGPTTAEAAVQTFIGKSDKEVQATSVRFEELRTNNMLLELKVQRLEDEVQKLKEEKLKSTKIRAKAAASAPRLCQSIENIGKKQTKRRAKKMANLITNRSPSAELTSAEQVQFLRTIKHKCGVISPQKARNLDAEEDLYIILLSGISFNQRKKLKIAFGKHGIDFFASNRQLEASKKLMAVQFKLQMDKDWNIERNQPTFICMNIGHLIQSRIQALADNNMLVTRPEFRGRIVIAVAGDKGGDAWSGTKFGMLVGNTPNPNRPSNFTILATYQGDDNRAELENRLGPVLQQINNIKQVTYTLLGQEITAPIQWMLTGDIKFIGALMGHQGSSASFPCPICEARKKDLSAALGTMRTSAGIAAEVAQFERQQQTCRTTKAAHSYNKLPLLPIEPTEIIPPAFHILHGVTARAVDLLMKFAEKCGNGPELADQLKRGLHCKRDPHTKQFRGGDLHNMVQEANIEELCANIPEGESRRKMIALFVALQTMHRQSRIGFVQNMDVFRTQTSAVLKCWKALEEHDEKAGQIFPKLHLLAAHAPEFAQRNGWWALVNEQGVENVHGTFNRLTPRYANTGDHNISTQKMMRHQWMLNCLHDRGYGRVESDKENENSGIRKRNLTF